jgi:hypothetical protein
VQLTAQRGHPFLQADQAEAAAARGVRELGTAAAVVRDPIATGSSRCATA